MHEFFTPISNADDIRQGDIIRKIDSQSGEINMGVIITADCDIAQKKAGGRYTWLEILPMSSYIDGLWSETLLRKLAEKRAKTICEPLNAQIRKLDSGLADLVPDTLFKWLKESSPEKIILDIFGTTHSPESKVFKDLKGLALTVGVDDKKTSAFCRLKNAWDLFGTKEDAQQEIVRAAFKDGGGFQDYFVLPELPNAPGIGFIVMLRSMSTVMAADLFLTEQDARINDCPDAFYRLGRLSDGVRFAITQKMAFLFSRIGMPKTFESACEAATEVMVEDLFGKNVEKA